MTLLDHIDYHAQGVTMTLDVRYVALLTGESILTVKIMARAMGWEEVQVNSPIFHYKQTRIAQEWSML